MKIIYPYSETGWITAVIENRWVQAKLNDEPSGYGINNSRVSKLAVGRCSKQNPHKNFFEQMCYYYDLELDFDKAPEGLIDKIITELEKLPKIMSKNVIEEQTVEQKLNIQKKSRFSL